MAFTAPMTFVAGNVLTAAQMNTYVRDNFKAVAGVDKANCRIFPSLPQPINNSTETAVLFDSERFDYQAMHSTVSNTTRITIPTNWGGLYLIGATAHFAGNATGSRQFNIRINGVSFLASVQLDVSTNNVFHGGTPVAWWIYSAGDYVELVVWQNCGGTLSTDAGAPDGTELWAVWEGTG